MASEQGSMGIPPHASQGSVPPWHALNAIAISRDAHQLHDVGVNRLLQGMLTHGLQPLYNTDPYLHLPAKLVFDSACRNPLVSQDSCLLCPQVFS